MASSVISAILNLSDKMSPKLVQCGRSWDNLSKAEQRSVRASIAEINRLQTRIDKLASTTLKLGVGAAAAAVGLGFSEAFDLEGYRSQLETATKDTQRAAEVMRYSINLANVTPYEGGDMVSAASVLEMASLKAETYLTTLGDTAAGVNRNISDVQTQFAKAFSTGKYGEFFDSINVSRKSFEDFVKANKLSTASLEDTQYALKAFLDEKFGGGMAKLAATTKGAWSTITGVVKSGLAQLVGMGTDGTVRVGSALDILRNKAQDFSSELVEMQENGQLEAKARELGSALGSVMDIGSNVLTTLYDYRGAVVVFASAAGAIWLAQKAMAAYKTVTELVRVATMLLNGTMMLSPWALVVMGLGAAVGIGANWLSTLGSITDANTELTDSNNELTNSINGVTNAKEKLNSIDTGIKDGNKSKGFLTDKQYAKASAMREKADKDNGLLPTIFGNTIATGYEIGSIIGNGLMKAGEAVGRAEQWLWNDMVAASRLFGIDKLLGYANGTQYHTGGLALVGERGPELVNLPRGSSVTPAEHTKLGGGNTFNISVTVSGAQRSDEEIAEAVAKRIVEEVDSVW